LRSNLQCWRTPFSFLTYRDPKHVSVSSCFTTFCLSHKNTWFLCTHFARSVCVRTWKFLSSSMAIRSVESVTKSASWCWGKFSSLSKISSYFAFEREDNWNWSEWLIVKSWPFGWLIRFRQNNQRFYREASIDSRGFVCACAIFNSR
jgi:hypothetical protein